MNKIQKRKNEMKVDSPAIRFASKLHSKLGKSKENSFYSPHSLLSALGMCAEGANGDTLKTLTELLEVPSDSSERKSYFRSLVAETVVEENKPYELSTANALWPQTNLGLIEEFAETIRQDYGGDITEVDYQKNPNEAARKINDWCDKATRGKIPKIIDSIDNDMLLILTNAIYFLGKWKSQFKKELTTDEDFRTSPSVIKKVPTMHKLGDAIYGETQEFKVLELPYEGDDLSMLILLPEGSTENIDNDLTSAYQNALNSLQHTEEVHVSLPKFKMETEYRLGSKLKELGAGLIFSDNADFSGITKKENLKISEIIHKAFVKCDEEGTEAAAVTAVMIQSCSVSRSRPKVFRADHPFVFFIRNMKTNTVLFVGRVANP